MDPNEVLKRLREYVKDWSEATLNRDDSADDLDTVLDLFDALDTWIAAGGFIPRDWEAE
jgi:hypothetical protein